MTQPIEPAAPPKEPEEAKPSSATAEETPRESPFPEVASLSDTQDLLLPAAAVAPEPAATSAPAPKVGVHRRRLFLTLAIAACLMVLESWAPPGIWRPWTALALAGAALGLAGDIVLSSLRALSRGRLHSNTVAALGAIAAFLGGIAAAALMTLDRLSAQAFRSPEELATGVTHLGLDAAVLLLALPHLARLLDARSRDRAKAWIATLRGLRPSRARVVSEHGDLEVPVDWIRDGYQVSVRTGERIPVDSILVGAAAEIDESILGSARVCSKRQGDRLFAGTVNRGNGIVVKARGQGKSCAWTEAMNLAEDAMNGESFRVPGQTWFVTGLTVAGLAVAAVLSVAVWRSGFGYGPALTAGLAVLAAAWPGAITLAGRLAAHFGLARVTARGCLVRGASVFQQLSRVQVAFFTKTGTLTGAQPRVSKVLPLQSEMTAEDLLFLATILELRSEHPIATGILQVGMGNRRTIPNLRGFRAVPGRGLRAVYHGSELLLGNLKLLEESGIDTTPLLASHAALASQGHTPLAISLGGKVLGLIAMEDEVRPGVREAIEDLRDLGIRSALVTGDCQAVAEILALSLGIDETHADLPPHAKAETIVAMREKGRRVVGIGHGITDAPLLAAADSGIALQAAGDLSLDAADALILGPPPDRAVWLIRCARETISAARWSLATAFTLSLATLVATTVASTTGRAAPALWAAFFAAVSTTSAAGITGTFSTRSVEASRDQWKTDAEKVQSPPAGV